ncbi:MAG TPA: flagellin [Acetobacteraceae bacterium]|nr:flagellin [Acetobacteraceae bacterium]
MIVTGYPGFDRTAQAAADLRARVAEYAFQAAGGKRSDSYVGLGVDARRAVDMRAELTRRDGLMTLAERAQARATHTQVLLTRMQDIAKDFIGKANGLVGLYAETGPLVAQSAQAALQEVVGMLGESFEGNFVFGGENTHKPPIVEPEQIFATDMFTQIRNAVQTLNAGNGMAIAASTRAIAMDDSAVANPVFSEHARQAKLALITDSRRAVPIEEGVTVEIGMFVNRNAAAVSTHPDTTGSWSRDLLRGLMTLASIRPEETQQGAGYIHVVQSALGAFRSCLQGLTEEAGALGAQQARIEAAKVRHEEVSVQVEIQLGKVEHVELAEAITRATATRSLLEASYRSMSMLADLSLARFLR